MKTTLKTTLLAALPLAGLLLLNAPAFAHGDGQHERFHNNLGELHEQEHENLGALHQEFHEYPYSRREHRRFHRWLNREHNGFHKELYNEHGDYHDRDWDWGRRYDRNYYRGQYEVQRPYNGGWYHGDWGLPWWRR
jgi:hypothetical protein